MIADLVKVSMDNDTHSCSSTIGGGSLSSLANIKMRFPIDKEKKPECYLLLAMMKLLVTIIEKYIGKTRTHGGEEVKNSVRLKNFHSIRCLLSDDHCDQYTFLVFYRFILSAPCQCHVR